MNKIIRTKTRAAGGITPDEKARMDEHAKLWISRVMRTDPIDPEKIIPAIEGLYAAANLKRPRIVIVPSPLVMAFAGGFAAAIWHERRNNIEYSAAATRAATYVATRAATDAATCAATYVATRAATDAATDAATVAATDAAVQWPLDIALQMTQGNVERATFWIQCAKKWNYLYQGGNMWGQFDSYLTAARDILWLQLPIHDKYAAWEQAAIHGGFRIMHEEFCMVSDFPEFILVDDNNQPHCTNGPTHRWRDGWELFHWHGQSVPREWILSPETMNARSILAETNMEKRRAGCEIMGWLRVLDEVDAKILDKNASDLIGTLYRADLPDAPDSRILTYRCPTGRIFAQTVPDKCNTAIAAQQWIWNDPDYHPEVET